MGRTVLITGGTGTLGSRVKQRLVDRYLKVRIMSRHQPEGNVQEGVEWAVAQLASGDGVREAVSGMDVIVHTASSPFPATMEIDSAANLLKAAREAGVRHFVYISIIGVDRISFNYYKSKLQVEQMIENSGLEFSILRAAQFHTFVEMIIQPMAKLPLIFYPKGWQFQSIDPGDVARLLVEAVQQGPQGRMSDAAGPEILTLEQMIMTWTDLHRARKLPVALPIPGGLSRGFQAGYNTAPENAIDGVTWGQYVRQGLNVSEPVEDRRAEAA